MSDERLERIALLSEIELQQLETRLAPEILRLQIIELQAEINRQKRENIALRASLQHVTNAKEKHKDLADDLVAQNMRLKHDYETISAMYFALLKAKKKVENYTAERMAAGERILNAS